MTKKLMRKAQNKAPFIAKKFAKNDLESTLEKEIMLAPSIESNHKVAKPTPISEKKYKALFKNGETALRNWQPLKTHPVAAPYQVIDFFSGCGGMSLGFSALGLSTNSFEVIGGCDIDPVAAKTFELNHGAPCIVADIAELSNSKSKLTSLLKKYPRYDANRQTILIGCAPCQGFSSHRKKAWDDPDARNSLPARFAKIAKELNPACVVMENVPEMLSKKYWKEFTTTKKILESAGYVVKQSIYNAAEFGVPQERFRAVVIAMKKDFILYDPKVVRPTKFITVRDAIGNLKPVASGERTPTDALHYSATHKKTTLETIRAVPKNGGNRPAGVGPACLDRIKGFSDVYGRLFWDRPSITITHYARNPASGRFVHPQQDRGLTMRECAILQSFPNGFIFEGNSDAIYRQIGEAVPPLLSLGVAVNVLCEIDSITANKIKLENGIRSIEAPVSSSYSSVIAGLKSSRRNK